MAARWLRSRTDRPAPVYLHIGGPSTGTTYLQRLLLANQDALDAAGVLLPGQSWPDVVLAVHDVLGSTHDAHRTAQARGRWDRIAAEMVAHRGRATVLSMEFLCWAGPEVAARIIASLEGAEVHVVLTVRDTAAVVRSQWQTTCRNGAVVPLRRLIWGLRQQVEKQDPTAPPASRPERMIDRAVAVPRILDTWVPLVGPERMHVVTVPLRSDDPDLLWKRFARVVGIKPKSCPERAVESNSSLGRPSSELMRLLNVGLGPVSRPEYLRSMKSLLGRDILAGRARQEPKVTLNRPGRNLSARWNKRLRAAITDSGAKLVGSLDDLPVEHVGPEVSAELPQITDAELIDAAAWARERLTAAVAELEDDARALRETGEAGGHAEESDGESDGDDGDDGSSHDDAGPDEASGDDGPQDPVANLERQLAKRSPEVRDAVLDLLALVRRAIALGTEVTELRSRAGRPASRTR